MLRNQVAPSLRALGMRGSGGSFTLPDPTHHLLVGVQASLSSTTERVRLTVNLATIDKAAWTMRSRPGWPRPSANCEGLIGVHARLGEVMPDQDDLWWDVLHADDSNSIAEHVCSVVQEYGIPWLLAARSDPRASIPWTELNEQREVAED